MEKPTKTKFSIEFVDEHDAYAFLRYIEKAKEQDGTVTGLYAGILCSALKRAKVK